MPFSLMVALGVRILVSIDPVRFDYTFAEVVCGNSLMYSSYRFRIAEELITGVLVQLALLPGTKRNLLKRVVRAVRMSVFDKKYVHLLHFVISLVKAHFDSAALVEFRLLVILGFHLLRNELGDYFRLIAKHRDLVFNSETLDDVDFCHFYLFQSCANSSDDPSFKACAAAFSGAVDHHIISLYKGEDVARCWATFVFEYTKDSAVDNSLAYAEVLIERTKKDIFTFSKAKLSANVFRIANLAAATRAQINENVNFSKSEKRKFQ
jgi:hypothetical protein